MLLEVQQVLCSSALTPLLVEVLLTGSSLPSLASEKAQREEEDRLFEKLSFAFASELVCLKTRPEMKY